MQVFGGWIRAALAALVVGIAVLAGAAPAQADVDDFEFSSLDVLYELSRDAEGVGQLRVTETFVAEFPRTDQNRGIRRAIPDTYLGAPLEPEFVSVTDENGQPRPADVEHEDGEFRRTSRADGYLHGSQTFVFTYELANVGRTMDNGVDEFYWDVNGDLWSQPFGSVTAEVRVDAELAERMTGDAACYEGSRGSEARCDIAVGSDGVVTAGAGPFGPRETMTIAVGFEPGTFTVFDASYLGSPWGWAQLVAAAGGLAGLVLSIIARVRRLRDAPGRGVIIPEFAPPEGFDATRSAVLLGRTSKAIPAELLEQAVLGSVRIVEMPGSGWFSKTKMGAQLLDPFRADANGRTVLGALFPGMQPGAVYEFGKTDNRFVKTTHRVLETAKRNTRAMRKKVSSSVRGTPILITVLALLAAIGCGIGATVSHVDGPLPFVVPMAVFAMLFVTTIVLAKQPLSDAGAEARDHLLGLKMFMEWAEADRIRMLQSPEGAERSPVDANDPGQVLYLYEHLLPYAVIFGQEKKWAEELAVRYGDTAPGWYHGSGAFNAAAFSSGMASVSTGVASSSTASSSGGSSGGGSAGGGGGGGGGGGV